MASHKEQWNLKNHIKEPQNKQGSSFETDLSRKSGPLDPTRVGSLVSLIDLERISPTLSSTQSSTIKIIDVQRKTPTRSSLNKEEHPRSGVNGGSTGNLTSERANPRPQAASISPLLFHQQQQLENSSGGTLTNRWSPQVRVNSPSSNNQFSKQEQTRPSGEGQLSSFESDYDLLLYLGETETEDIVDTERSLDYQDQTWRQSICGGASLAPTIDGSFSELLGISTPSNNNNHDFDLLNTPTTPQALGASPSLSESKSFNATGRSNSKNQLAPIQRAHYLQNPNLRVNNDENDTEYNYEVSEDFKQADSPTGGMIRKTRDDPLRENSEQRLTYDKPPYNQQILSELEKSRTLDMRQPKRADNERANTMTRLPIKSNESDELDRLLAEMSESLDLQALARYDTGATQQLTRDRVSVQARQASNHVQVKASSESLLDDYDGASRILEQMIAEQLESRPSIKRFRQPAPPLPPLPPQHEQHDKKLQVVSDQRQHNQHPFGQLAGTRESSLKSVASGSQIAEKSAPEQAVPPTKAAQSSRSNPQSSQQVVVLQEEEEEEEEDEEEEDEEKDEEKPPRPPAPDYFTDIDIEPAHSDIIKLEVEKYPASSELLESRSIILKEPESQINRMKRRTLSSMRVVKHKISDFVSSSGNNADSRLSRKNEASNRASSISLGRLTSEEPEKELAQERESRSFSRRANAKKRDDAAELESRLTGKDESFGEQIMRRLSRSKSRVSRWLLRGSRWEKRTQSTPNTKSSSQALSETSIREKDRIEDEDRDNLLLQLQPGDIARNSKLSRLPQSSVAAINTEPDFSNQKDLDRRELASNRKSSVSEASSGFSHLSGLERGPPELAGKIRPARSRSRQLAAREQKAAEEKKARTASLISLKRLSMTDSPSPAHLESSCISGKAGSKSRSQKVAKRTARPRRKPTEGAAPPRSVSGLLPDDHTSTATSSSSGSSSPREVEYFAGVRREPRERRLRRRSKSCDPKSQPPRSSSLRSVRSTSRQQQVTSQLSGSEDARGCSSSGVLVVGKPSGNKRTVSFSNLSSGNSAGRSFRGTTGTFRPASSLVVRSSNTPLPPVEPETLTRDRSHTVNNQPTTNSGTVTPVGLSAFATQDIPASTPSLVDQKSDSTQGVLFRLAPYNNSELPKIPVPRAKSTALLTDLKNRYNELRKSSKSPPVPPPRRQRGSRSKSMSSAREVGASKAEPPLSQPVDYNGGQQQQQQQQQQSRLSSLATQLKLSATDFFSPNSRSAARNSSSFERSSKAPGEQQQVEISTGKSIGIEKEKKKLLQCEWKPVIEVPPTRASSFSRKFRPYQSCYNNSSNQSSQKKTQSTTSSSLASKRLLTNSSLQGGHLKEQAAYLPIEANHEWQEETEKEEAEKEQERNLPGKTGMALVRRQQSLVLDTDSTWESSSCDDNDFQHDDLLVQAPNDVRSVRVDESWRSGRAERRKSLSNVCAGGVNEDDDQPSSSRKNWQDVYEGRRKKLRDSIEQVSFGKASSYSSCWKQGVQRAQGEGGDDKVNKPEPLVAGSDNNNNNNNNNNSKQQQEQQLRSDIPIAYSHYPEQQVASSIEELAREEELKRNREIPLKSVLSAVASEQAQPSSAAHHSLTSAMQVHLRGELCSGENNGETSELEEAERKKNSFFKAESNKQEEDLPVFSNEAKLSTLIDHHSNEKKSPDLKTHQTHQTQSVCNGQFTFNSDLPNPAESVNSNWKEKLLLTQKRESEKSEKLPLKEPNGEPAKPARASHNLPNTTRMALSNRIPDHEKANQESKETTLVSPYLPCKGALDKSPRSNRNKINNDTQEQEQEQEKRLSHYENVHENHTSSHPVISNKLPAWPPVAQHGQPKQSQAEGRKSVEGTSSGQNSIWSLDEIEEKENAQNYPLSVSQLQRQRQQLKMDLNKCEADKTMKGNPLPLPPHPERKLVHMLSIIQDPNDELMVTSTSNPQEAAQASQVTSGEEVAEAAHEASSASRWLSRQDSAFSLTGNNSDSESSVMQQVGSNKQRLLAKLQPQKASATSVSPCSFVPARAASSSSSRVKRLAQTFESVASQQQQPNNAQYCPAGSRGLHSTLSSMAQQQVVPISRSFASAEEDPRSEASTGSDWYDTNEQLDQIELAKFLEELDSNDSNTQRSVSTGADPFVTLADSTLDDRAFAGARQVNEARDVTDDEDNTLNDAASSSDGDEDILSDYCEAPEQDGDGDGDGDDDDDDEAIVDWATEGEQGKETHDGSQQRVRLRATSDKYAEGAGCCEGAKTTSGEGDKIALRVNERERDIVASGIDGWCNEMRGEDGCLAGAADEQAASCCTTTSSDLSTVVSAIEQQQVAGIEKESLVSTFRDSESDNNNFNASAERDFQSNSSSSSGCINNNHNNNNNRFDDHCCATNKTTKSALASASSPKTVHSPVDTTTTSQLTKKQLDYDNKTLTPHAQPHNHHLINHQQPEQQQQQPQQLQPTKEDFSGSAWTSKGKLDDSFRNSLNLIIGQHQHQHQHQQMVGNGQQQRQQQTLNSKNTHQHPHDEREAAKKELKGLTRYYRAILRRRKGSNKSEKQSSSITKKAEIRDYIHSSSSSDDDNSSDSDESSSEHLLGTSAESGKASSLEQSKQQLSCRAKLAKNAKKCARLCEELERILLRKVELTNGKDQEKQQQQQQQRKSSENNENKQQVDQEQEVGGQNEEEADNEGYYYEGSISSAAINGAEDQISLSSSSVSCDSLPEIRQRQNLQKLYNIVKEIHSSEAKFVETLKLMNVELRAHMEPITSSSSVAHQAESLGTLLKHLPQLQALNESLLDELGLAMSDWPRTRKIAHVLVKIGPFLKHYSTYIRDFDTLQQQLADAQRKYPQFAERIRQFEARESCQRLSIQHHLLKPIQRIPQYRLLLQQYLHYLKPDDLDYEDTVNALEVVSRVAEHANQAMNEGANFAKLLALQAKIVGKQRDIVQPGRLFIREGELMKVCRKQVQPRWFVLLSDALLYLTQIQSNDILYLNNELPLDDCQVSTPNEQQANLIGKQFDTEFSVCTRTRSFALVAKSRDERDQWVSSLRQTISEHLDRKRSFTSNRSCYTPAMGGDCTDTCNLSKRGSLPSGSSSPSNQSKSEGSTTELLGMKAPLWTPDSRVSMCQLCTSSFSALFRRHHCRACGKVVCSACSSNRAPLMYLKCRAARTCDPCFQLLRANIHLYYLASNSAGRLSHSEQELKRLDEHFKSLLKSQFVRHADWRGLAKIARSTSSGSSKSSFRHHLLSPLPNSNPVDQQQQQQQPPQPQQQQPSSVDQLAANDSGSIISGYLHRRHAHKAKWKRQWFVITRERVLFAYRAIDDVAHVSSLPLLGYQVDQPIEPVDGLEPTTLLRLTHLSSYSTAMVAKQPKPIIHLFKAESVGAAERWLDALKRSVVLDDMQEDVVHEAHH